MLFQPRTYKETSRPGTNEVARALSGRRLLFVINDLDFFISHRLPIARAARQAGMEVAVAAAPGLAATRLQAEGIGFHPVPVTRSGAHPRKELRVIWRLYRLFRSWRPDLIHAVTIKGVLYAGLAARFAHAPAVVSAIPGLGHVFIQQGMGAALARWLVMFGYRIALSHPRSRVIFRTPRTGQRFCKPGQRGNRIQFSYGVRGSTSLSSVRSRSHHGQCWLSSRHACYGARV